MISNPVSVTLTLENKWISVAVLITYVCYREIGIKILELSLYPSSNIRSMVPGSINIFTVNSSLSDIKSSADYIGVRKEVDTNYITHNICLITK